MITVMAALLASWWTHPRGAFSGPDLLDHAPRSGLHAPCLRSLTRLRSVPAMATSFGAGNCPRLAAHQLAGGSLAGKDCLPHSSTMSGVPSAAVRCVAGGMSACVDRLAS